MNDRPGEEWERIWNMPRGEALALLSSKAHQIAFMIMDEDALDRELGELDYLIHTTRERIFFDARERNRLLFPPVPKRTPRPTIQPTTLEDLI